MLFSGVMVDENQLLEKVRKNIKRLRLKKGLTHKEMGFLFDPPLDKQYIQRIEKGGTSPTLKTLVKFANALEVELIELLK